MATFIYSHSAESSRYFLLQWDERRCQPVHLVPFCSSQTRSPAPSHTLPRLPRIPEMIRPIYKHLYDKGPNYTQTQGASIHPTHSGWEYSLEQKQSSKSNNTISPWGQQWHSLGIPQGARLEFRMAVSAGVTRAAAPLASHTPSSRWFPDSWNPSIPFSPLTPSEILAKDGDLLNKITGFHYFGLSSSHRPQ